MRKTISFSLFLIAISVLYFACTKDKLQENKAEILLSADNTQVRFINALSSNSINTVSPVTATTAPPSLNFFVSGTRLNGISTTTTYTTAYGGAFPGTAIALAGSANGNNVFDYASFPGGTFNVAGVLYRATGGTAADTVLSTSLTLEKGKKYTVVAGDVIPNQKFFAFEDVFTTPDTANYSIRIINMGVDVPNVDVYSRRKGGILVGNVAYKSASAFIQAPVTVSGVTNDTLEIRQSGSSTTLFQANGFFPVKTRVYTFVVRGVTTLASPRNLQVAGYLNR